MSHRAILKSATARETSENMKNLSLSNILSLNIHNLSLVLGVVLLSPSLILALIVEGGPP